jgi:hypothetical protein
VEAETRLRGLIQVIAKDRGDVDLAGAQAGDAGSGIRDASDDELLERRRLPPVVRHRLEPVEIALPALDVPIGTGADRVKGGLLLADFLEVLLRRGVLVADELGEERGHFPHPSRKCIATVSLSGVSMRSRYRRKNGEEPRCASGLRFCSTVNLTSSAVSSPQLS